MQVDIVKKLETFSLGHLKLYDEYRLVLEIFYNSPLAQWYNHPNGECTHINNAWLHMAGLDKKEDALGRRWLESYHPDDIDRVRQAWQTAVETQSSFYVHARIVNKKTSSIIWVTSQAEPLFDEQGQLSGFVGYTMDTTAYEGRVYGATWSYNLQTGAVSYSSPSPDDPIKKKLLENPTIDSFYSLIHPEDLPIVSQALQEHLTNNEPFQVIFRLPHNGSGYRLVFSQGHTVTVGDQDVMVGALQVVSSPIIPEKEGRHGGQHL